VNPSLGWLSGCDEAHHGGGIIVTATRLRLGNGSKVDDAALTPTAPTMLPSNMTGMPPPKMTTLPALLS
jgi:hypothetical protein